MWQKLSVAPYMKLFFLNRNFVSTLQTLWMAPKIFLPFSESPETPSNHSAAHRRTCSWTGNWFHRHDRRPAPPDPNVRFDNGFALVNRRRSDRGKSFPPVPSFDDFEWSFVTHARLIAQLSSWEIERMFQSLSIKPITRNYLAESHVVSGWIRSARIISFS